MTDNKAGHAWFTLSMLRPIDLLLLCVPAAFLIDLVPAFKNETLLFFISGLAIIPITRWMSQATENLGERTGPGVGGLINATFGNAPELIFALMALSKGLIDVVKASIIGSILGNILVVLGIAITAAGLRYPHLKFNRTGIQAASTSLALATVGLIIPSVFHSTLEHHSLKWTQHAEQNISVALALVLLVTYVLWLIFSLITHSNLFSGRSSESHAETESTPAAWPMGKAILVLGVSAVLMAFMSDFLAGSVESVCHSLGLTQVFVSVIVVAIIGNAAEATAVVVALKNKMDMCLSITIGSSLQIALFVTPLLVLASHFFGNPMTLHFSIPELASLIIAVGLVVLISGDGECNWVEGAQLLSVYLLIAILFYFLPDATPEPMEKASLVQPILAP